MFVCYLELTDPQWCSGSIMKPKKTDYTDVSDVGITDEKRERLYQAQTECVVNWTNREGWPVGVMHRFVWHEEKFWVT